MNENVRKLIDLCTEKKLSLGNTLFEKNDIHKYAWLSEVNSRNSYLILL